MNPELIIQTIRDAGAQRDDPQVSGPYQHLAGLIEAHVIGQPYFDQHPPHTLTATQWLLLRHGVASVREGRAVVALRQAAERLAASLTPISAAAQPDTTWEEPQADAIDDEDDDASATEAETPDISAQSAPDMIILPPEQPSPYKQERADLPPAPVEPRFSSREAQHRAAPPAAETSAPTRPLPTISPTAQTVPVDDELTLPLPYDDHPLSYSAETQATGTLDPDPRAIHFDVFISFDHEDNRLRERIERHLHQQGFQVFSDRRINPGTPTWQHTIEEAIRESLSVVIVQTPAAARSEWVRREISYARKYNVPLLVLLAGDERRSAMLDIETTQHIDVRGGKYDAGMRALLRELRRRRSSRSS